MDIKQLYSNYLQHNFLVSLANSFAPYTTNNKTLILGLFTSIFCYLSTIQQLIYKTKSI